MKLWLVKFYIKEIHSYNKPTYRPGFLGMLKMELKTETEIKEKEIHSCLVDSEEKADLLVKAFTSVQTSAKKIELLDNPKIMGSTIKEVYIDEVVYDNKKK